MPATQRTPGRYEITAAGGEQVRAFIPTPLPPEPYLDFSGLQLLLEQATQALGRLDGIATFLPNLHLLIYAYVRKEALLSSQIEGTQSSLSDLLMYENDQAPGVPLDDVQEVSSYVQALEYGLARLPRLPLSLRLIREIHSVLLAHGRGRSQDPGEFRRTQNWIGGTRPGNAMFVPPPPNEVLRCMGELETFLHLERPDLPVLIKAGLAHVQFETIHPFSDGNGRLGRLLITFLLCATGTLSQPILYLSLFFKEHRETYYSLLTRVRTEGAWEAWLEFFLTGVRQTAEQAIDTTRRILALMEKDRQHLETIGRGAASALRVFQLLQTRPIVSTKDAARALELTFPTASAALEALRKAGIVREVTGRERNRLYSYGAYLDILSEGTQPLPR